MVPSPFPTAGGSGRGGEWRVESGERERGEGGGSCPPMGEPSINLVEHGISKPVLTMSKVQIYRL